MAASKAYMLQSVNSSPLDKMTTVLADNIFKRIFLNENVRIAIQISLNFVPKGSIDNKPALNQVIAWLPAYMRTKPVLPLCCRQGPAWI